MPTPAIHLGIRPKYLVVSLTPGVGFYAPMLNKVNDLPADFPDGTVITLRIGSTTWTATVDGANAVFDEDEAAVDAVLATKPTKVKLFYSTPALPTPICWALGDVDIHV